MSDYWFKSWPNGVKKTLNYPNISIHHHYENIVKKNSEMAYISILGIDYSYQEVNNYASKIAKAFIELGMKKGDKIGIFAPNIPQFVFTFFGILKAGCIVVPISPLLGTEDLKEVIKDSEMKAIMVLDLLYPTLEKVCGECEILNTVIITSLGDLLSPIKRKIAKLIRKLPASPKIKREHMSLYDLINSYPPLENSIECNPSEDVAVIAYTGGTTGTPKGAMLSHKNIISNMFQAREWGIVNHPEGEHKNFLGAVPFFHIIGLTTVMLATAQYDSTVYLVANPRDFESILKIIEKNKINYFHGVPTLFRALMKLKSFSKYDTSSLEIIFSGAAPLPAELGKEIENKFGNAIVVEAFGMTELSPMVAANPMNRKYRRFGSIGLPIVDTKLKIVDSSTGKDLPQGETGEICAAGPQVMLGYYNNLKETESTIVDGWLHTGDVGYMDEDGFFYIRSRIKDMIIVSGYKVFPNELENMIEKEFEEIKELAVIGIPDEYQGEAVKLIVVLKDGYSLNKEKIINFLDGKVAKFKIPRIVEFRKEELPKTGIGKIDRKSLN